MYKIQWSRSSDEFYKSFVIVPDIYALFDLYHIFKNAPRVANVVVTDLDGNTIDMTAGLPDVASRGTYGSHS